MTSNFKLFQGNENLELFLYRVRHLRPVLKPFGGVTVLFVVLGSSLILLNPFQTNFSVYQKSLYGKTKNLLKTGFAVETKYLKIVHGTVVNYVVLREL